MTHGCDTQGDAGGRGTVLSRGSTTVMQVRVVVKGGVRDVARREK